MKKIYAFASALALCAGVLAQTPCELGAAAGYPCSNIDLLSVVPVGDINAFEMNDIWGWTDEASGREFVLAGHLAGVAFLEITDPVNPVFLGTLPTATNSSLWRDVKVYNNHAYVVSEAGGHGMQVFDLSQLLNVNNPPQTFGTVADYNLFGSAHNIAINEESGYAYAIGTGTFAGGLHVVDISNPNAPQIAGGFSDDGYTHDCQAVNYIGPDQDYTGKEIVIAFNENTVTIVDVSDKSDMTEISRTGYAGSRYTHQGWLTPDHKFLLHDDELDEAQNNTNTRTFMWDVQDLDAPVLLGFYEAADDAIDHNLYTRGNLSYNSNYRAGLRLFNTTDIANGNINEVAFFDVWPANNNTQFNGAWSSYPYFESGVVAVTSIEGGVFLLRPQFLTFDDGDASILGGESATASFNILDGFEGPYSWDLQNLPSGATAAYTLLPDATNPTTVEVTVSNLPNANASYDFRLMGSGSDHTYFANWTLETVETTEWFEDTDNDGFGNPDVSVFALDQPAGFVENNNDCDDTNDTVYLNAPGTGQGIDNNCDNEVSGDEVLNECQGDLNNDGTINTLDLVSLVSELGCTMNCLADLNGDDATNTGDLLIIIGILGTDCIPDADIIDVEVEKTLQTKQDIQNVRD